MPVRHVQAWTEACQTIECILSFQICVILCRRFGSRNDVVIRQIYLFLSGADFRNAKTP